MTAQPSPDEAPGPERTVVQRIVNIYGNMTGTINEVNRVVEVGSQTERRRLLRAVRMLVEEPMRDEAPVGLRFPSLWNPVRPR